MFPLVCSGKWCRSENRFVCVIVYF